MKSHKKHFDGQLRKECSICHEIKSYSEFSRRNDLNPEKEFIRSACKKCRAKSFAILIYDIKLKVTTNIYQGRFKGKCLKCQTNIESLPVLEFHHLYPELKTTSWSNIPKKNWKETMEILEAQRVNLLCRNCHTKENSKIFNQYYEIILKKDLFDFPSLVIDKMVYNCVSRKKNGYNKKDKFLVIEWIKKRKIIEDLYDGKCVGCNQINIYNNLPSLEFHHKFYLNKDKELGWKNIRKNNLVNIAQLLIKEGCICLCSNCHKLIHSNQFENNLHHFYNKELSQKIRNKYRKIKSNIKNFNFKSIKYKDPLEKIYGYGDNWKKVLLTVHALSVINNNDLVGFKELLKSLGITERNLNKALKNLEEMDLVKILKLNNNKCIKITQKAFKSLNKILEILEKYVNLQEKLPNNFQDREINDLIKWSKILI